MISVEIIQELIVADSLVRVIIIIIIIDTFWKSRFMVFIFVTLFFLWNVR